MPHLFLPLMYCIWQCALTSRPAAAAAAAAFVLLCTIQPLPFSLCQCLSVSLSQLAYLGDDKTSKPTTYPAPSSHTHAHTHTRTHAHILSLFLSFNTLSPGSTSLPDSSRHQVHHIYHTSSCIPSLGTTYKTPSAAASSSAEATAASLNCSS